MMGIAKIILCLLGTVCNPFHRKQFKADCIEQTQRGRNQVESSSITLWMRVRHLSIQPFACCFYMLTPAHSINTPKDRGPNSFKLEWHEKACSCLMEKHTHSQRLKPVTSMLNKRHKHSGRHIGVLNVFISKHHRVALYIVFLRA